MTPDNTTGEFPFELRRSTPRAVQLTGQGIVVACMTALMPLGGLVLAAMLFGQSQRETALAQRMAVEGVTTTGTVMEIGPARGKDEHARVRFQFVAGGRTYTDEMDLPQRAAQELRMASQAPVRYLPSDPQKAWIGRHEPERLPMWIPAFVMFSMFLGPGLIWFRLRKERHLLEEGRPAWGTVIRTGRMRSQYNRGFRVRYEFQTMSGQTYKGTWDTKRRPPEPDGAVTVLYDPDEPKRNGCYPLQFFRIAES